MTGWHVIVKPSYSVLFCRYTCYNLFILRAHSTPNGALPKTVVTVHLSTIEEGLRYHFYPDDFQKVTDLTSSSGRHAFITTRRKQVYTFSTSLFPRSLLYLHDLPTRRTEDTFRKHTVIGTHRLCRAKLGDTKRPSIFRCFSHMAGKIFQK